MPEDYDFRQPMTLTREHARALEVAFQTFARQWGTLLSSRLGVLTTVTLDDIALRTYDDYIQSLPQTTTMVVSTVEASRTPAVLQIPTDTTMTLVDCLLGGPAVTLPMGTRELTEIEWALLGDMLEHASRELTYSFVSLMPIQLEIKGPKYNPQFMQVVPASEPVLVASFDMMIGQISSRVTLMFVAEPILVELRSSEDGEGKSAEERAAHESAVTELSKAIRDVPMPVHVRFGSRPASASEITALEVGSVLPLRHPADRPLDIVVGDSILAHAAIGAHGTRIACMVVSTQEEQ